MLNASQNFDGYNFKMTKTNEWLGLVMIAAYNQN